MNPQDSGMVGLGPVLQVLRGNPWWHDWMTLAAVAAVAALGALSAHPATWIDFLAQFQHDATALLASQGVSNLIARATGGKVMPVWNGLAPNGGK